MNWKLFHCKSFHHSCFEIRREGFLWIQQRNWKNGNINLLKFIQTLPSMYFINNKHYRACTLEWCRCFTWIVFIELSFIVAFLLIRKTLMTHLGFKRGGWGGGGGGGGGWYPLTDYDWILCILLKWSFPGIKIHLVVKEPRNGNLHQSSITSDSCS